MTSENPYLLTHASYDGVMSALTGNGELCTTLGPTGFHTADLGEPDAAHATQRFVLAGRRLSGPQHPLLNMGAITRDLYLDGVLAWAEHWEQFIDWQRGVVCSTLVHDHVREEAISCVALHCNQFLACVRLHNSGTSEREAAFLVRYAFAYPDSILRTSANLEEGSLEYGVEILSRRSVREVLRPVGPEESGGEGPGDGAPAVRADASLKEALGLMAARKVECLAVHGTDGRRIGALRMEDVLGTWKACP